MVVDDGKVGAAQPQQLAVGVVHDGSRSGRLDVVGQPSHADVAERHRRVRVVCLQGKGAVGEDAVFVLAGDRRRARLDVIDGQLVVHQHPHLLAADADAQPEPLVVRDQLAADISDAVQRTSLSPFPVASFAHVGVVDLDLEALRRPAGLLVGAVEVDPRVRSRPCHHVGFEVEVLEPRLSRIPDVIQKRPRPARDERAFLESPGAGILAGAPPVQ